MATLPDLSELSLRAAPTAVEDADEWWTKIDGDESDAQFTDDDSDAASGTRSPGRDKWEVRSDESDSEESSDDVPRTLEPEQPSRVQPARAAKLQRRNWHLLRDVPDDLIKKITETMASTGDSLEEVCNTIMNWCHTARGVGCRVRRHVPLAARGVRPAARVA